MPDQSDRIIPRRKFLGITGAGAVALGTAPYTAARLDEPAHDSDSKHRGQYRETDHVRTFYRVNRY